MCYNDVTRNFPLKTGFPNSWVIFCDNFFKSQLSTQTSSCQTAATSPPQAAQVPHKLPSMNTTTSVYYS